MEQLITQIVKAAVTLVLLVFMLGFGALGLCAMSGARGGEVLIALLLLTIAGWAVRGLARVIISLWSTKDDHRLPPADDA